MLTLYRCIRINFELYEINYVIYNCVHISINQLDIFWAPIICQNVLGTFVKPNYVMFTARVN